MVGSMKIGGGLQFHSVGSGGVMVLLDVWLCRFS